LWGPAADDSCLLLLLVVLPPSRPPVALPESMMVVRTVSGRVRWAGRGTRKLPLRDSLFCVRNGASREGERAADAEFAQVEQIVGSQGLGGLMLGHMRVHSNAHPSTPVKYVQRKQLLCVLPGEPPHRAATAHNACRAHTPISLQRWRRPLTLGR
jgi:hypothetical protein